MARVTPFIQHTTYACVFTFICMLNKGGQEEEEEGEKRQKNFNGQISTDKIPTVM